MIGRSYDIGIGVAQDYQEAVQWYRLAADQGNAYAQVKLDHYSVLYENGMGVVQNDQRAYIGYSVAAAQGDSDAASARDRTRALLTPQALQEAQALATRLSEYSYKDCGVVV